MKKLIVLCMSMGACTVVGMQEAQSQYNALINIEQMRVLAQQVEPKNYKKTLKQYNLTPQAMAACVRHFCEITMVEEEKEIQYFQNKKDVNYPEHIKTGVLMLQALRNESEDKKVTPLAWATFNTVRIISEQANAQQKDLEPKKGCYDESYRCTVAWGCAGLLTSVGLGIGLVVRILCNI